MQSNLPGRLTAITTAFSSDHLATDNYTGRLISWGATNPGRSGIAREILNQGGHLATKLEFFDLIDVPPFPLSLCTLSLNFHTPNIVYLREITAETIQNVLHTVPENNPDSGRHIDLFLNFNGFLLRNQISYLLNNLFSTIPTQYKNNLSLHAVDHTTNAIQSRSGAVQIEELPTDEELSTLEELPALEELPTTLELPAGLDTATTVVTPSQKIRAAIHTHLTQLKDSNGLNIAGKTISLDGNGGDFISGEDFALNEDTEWCLMRSGNTYQFITSTTAEQLASHGNKHPLNRTVLQKGDILRGQQVLDLLAGTHVDDAPSAATSTDKAKSAPTETVIPYRSQAPKNAPLQAPRNAPAPAQTLPFQIRGVMHANLQQLTANSGLKIGDKTFSLEDDGSDFINSEEFDVNQNTEWCLLRSEKTYRFITSETVENIINHGKKHPLLGTPLQDDDIIRGQQVLDLLKQPAQT